MNEKKILIVIPAYNEEKNILNTINNLKKNTTLDFIVVNDGSKDSTLRILIDNQIPYINHEINKGLSESLRTGMIYAINNNYDYILQMDGDNQHNPKDIINFSNNANNKNQIIIGNRYKNNKKGWSLKSFAQSLISIAFKLKTGIKLIDPTNGMRLYAKDFMNAYINNHNLMVEPSTIAYLTKKLNLEVMQVDASIKEREFGISMYNNKWRQFKYILREISRMLSLTNHWINKTKKEK